MRQRAIAADNTAAQAEGRFRARLENLIDLPHPPVRQRQMADALESGLTDIHISLKFGPKTARSGVMCYVNRIGQEAVVRQYLIICMLIPIPENCQ